MSETSPKEAVNKIKGLEGIGALIKTQTDMERVNRMLGASDSTFGARLN